MTTDVNVAGFQNSFLKLSELIFKKIYIHFLQYVFSAAQISLSATFLLSFILEKQTKLLSLYYNFRNFICSFVKKQQEIRLAEIFFTMPTILVGRNKSHLPNRYSYLPNIKVQLTVLNYSLKSIHPTPYLLHMAERDKSV